MCVSVSGLKYVLVFISVRVCPRAWFHTHRVHASFSPYRRTKRARPSVLTFVCLKGWTGYETGIQSCCVRFVPFRKCVVRHPKPQQLSSFCRVHVSFVPTLRSCCGPQEHSHTKFRAANFLQVFLCLSGTNPMPRKCDPRWTLSAFCFYSFSLK